MPGDQQSHFAMIGRQICVLLGMFLCKSTFIGRTRLGEVARTGIAVPCSYEWCFMSLYVIPIISFTCANPLSW